MNLQSIQFKVSLFCLLLSLFFSISTVIYYPYSSETMATDISIRHYKFLNSVIQNDLSKQIQSLQTDKGQSLKKKLLNYTQSANNHSGVLKISIFDTKLNYLDGFNTQDSDKIGIAFQHQNMVELRDVFRMSGPLLSTKSKVLGYYRIDYSKDFLNQKIEQIFDLSLKIGLVIFLFMISSTLFFSKFYILLPIQNMIDKVQIEANDTLQTTLDLEKRCMSVEGSIIRQSLNQKKLISLLEEISKDITSSYNTSKQAFHVSESSDKQSDDGLEIMEQMIQSIHETLQASHDTEKVILSIEEIAKKSDVLTLNAFVEVNRAGESGKTFAVIAEEIRKLTSKSTHAVQSTSNLVKSAIEKSKQGVLVSQALSETLQNLSKNNQMAFLLNSQLEDLSKIQDDKINKIKEFAKQVSTVISKGNESTQDNAKMIRGLHVKTTQLIETIDDLHHLIYRNR